MHARPVEICLNAVFSLLDPRMSTKNRIVDNFDNLPPLIFLTTKSALSTYLIYQLGFESCIAGLLNWRTAVLIRTFRVLKMDLKLLDE